MLGKIMCQAIVCLFPTPQGNNFRWKWRGKFYYFFRWDTDPTKSSCQFCL